MQVYRKFAFDVGITFIASAISMLLGFVIAVILGRYLGARELGLYSMTSTIYGIGMLIAGIGIPAAIIKYVAEYNEDRNKINEIVSSGVITSLLLGVGFSVLFYLSAEMLEKIFKMPGLSVLLKLLSPVFPFALVGGALLGLLNGLREMKKYGMATIVQSVLMIIVSIVLIYLAYGVAGAVVGIVLSTVGSCLYLVYISRSYFEITFKNYIYITNIMLKFGFRIFGANAINLINYQADTVLTGYFLTATDVGYYGVAAGLTRLLLVIPRAIQTISYPATSEYWGKNNCSALKTMINKSMKYTACILLPIGLAIGFLAEEIITTVFGLEFINSVEPLLILLAGSVIYGILVSVGGTLQGLGRSDLAMKMGVITASTNLILNLILIPILGLSGAALATTISLIVGTVIVSISIQKIGNICIDHIWHIKAVSLFLVILSLGYTLEIFQVPKLPVVAVLWSIYALIIIKFFLNTEEMHLIIDIARAIRNKIMILFP